MLTHISTAPECTGTCAVNGAEFGRTNVVFNFQRIYGVGGVFEKVAVNGQRSSRHGVVGPRKDTVELSDRARVRAVPVSGRRWRTTVRRGVIEERADSKVLTNSRPVRSSLTNTIGTP